MVFSSIQFLWVFLPVVLLLYWLFGDRWNIRVGNVILLIASLFFYAWGEPVYIFLMLGSVAVNYTGARLIHRFRQQKKLFLFLTIAVNLFLLGYFKYFDFLIGLINGIAQKEVFTAPEIALPLGISFYTFQAMSYVIDVYRGDVDAQKNFGKVLLYVSLFPQLIAGPIVKYRDIAAQIDERRATLAKRTYGIKRFCYGLAKKVILANSFGNYADILFDLPAGSLSTGLQWLKMLFYTLQIYFDFSGYSDMAIGLGSMFGFTFKENFDYPYTSRSIREFWKRWHISLSTWFKEYVYIPLGGNRKGTGRMYLNLLIVWSLTGLWHGASLNFVAWGLFYFCFLSLERLFLGKALDWLQAHHLGVIGLLYSWVVFMSAWVFFREETLLNAVTTLRDMFVYTSGTYTLDGALNIVMIALLVAGVLLSGFIQKWIPKLKDRLYDREKVSIPEFVFQAALLAICTFQLIGNAYNAFIYFRF